MNIKLTRWFEGEQFKPVAWIPEGGGLVLECSVTHPPSAVGRKAWLFLNRQDVDELLLELRSNAIEARR